MKRKYEFMIRTGMIAFALLCVLVCLATIVYTARGKETPTKDENLSQPACEAEVAVYEAEEETENIAEPAKAPADDQDLMLLAKLIACEMGCDWISAEQKYNVGSVVMNRVADPRFPMSIYDVIWQEGQYPAATNGALFTAQPSEEVIAIARDLLLNGSRLPADVVWQAEFPQGEGVYATYRDEALGTTTYYCY